MQQQLRNQVVSMMTTFTPKARSIRGTVEAPLTKEQILRVAPSIFTGSQNGNVSGRYRSIPTWAILEQLAEHGFHPYEVAQSQSQDEDKMRFGKHRVRLRHASSSPMKNGTCQEIILINSHDGTTSYRMMGGQFRFICSNGMVVSEGVLPSVRVKHAGDAADAVIEGCRQILRGMPRVAESIRSMEALMLSPEQQLDFAQAALKARYGDAVPPVTAEQILRPRRVEDVGVDLWRTMNRVQEALIRGGIAYVQRKVGTQVSGTRVVGNRLLRNKTRAVNEIGQNIHLNQTIWNLAENLVALNA